MKGVIMRAGPQKSIVFFNNGKFGTIPTPPNGEVGMIVSVSYNKKAAVLLSALCGALLICAMLTGGFLYFAPAGYIQVRYGAGETAALVELSYNRFSRIVDCRPLNAQAIEPLADSSLIRHTAVPIGYGELIKTFSRSPGLRTHNAEQTTVQVRIAQDDLARIKALAQDLSRLSEPLMAATGVRLSLAFELYTLELYRAATAGEDAQNGPSMQGDQHHHMMMNMGCRH